MSRIFFFIYGLVCYLIFFVTFLYLIGFVGDLIVPKTLDSGLEGSLSQALLINASLIGLFAIQHSFMARLSFKKWWTKVIPYSIERSTYVLMTSVVLLVLFWQWRPLGGIIWHVQNPIASYILYSIFGIGWLIVLLSTFLINHFDLLGLRQVYLYLRSQEYEDLEFKIQGLYKYVRHPLMLGFLIAFWATPKMSLTHLMFSIAMTVYILIAIRLEEQDLISLYGNVYQEYQQQASMLIPQLRIIKIIKGC